MTTSWILCWAYFSLPLIFASVTWGGSQLSGVAGGQ